MPNDELWNDDKLERKDVSVFLTKYLIALSRSEYQTESPVINLNAEWGYGKTYLLSKWHQSLKQSHPTIYIDAWKTDYSEEPLISFVNEFIIQIDEFIDDTEKLKVIKSKAKNGIANFFSGSSVGASYAGTTVMMSPGGVDPLTSYKQRTKSIDNFKSITKLITEHIESRNKVQELPLIILVDELDRCRPDYAIKLLEHIKHLFSHSREICFVVATDTLQLSKSIKAVYGSEFDSSRYLNRFFTHEYNLPKPELTNYVEHLLQNMDTRRLFSPDNDDNPATSICACASYFDTPLREIHRTIKIIEAMTMTFRASLPKPPRIDVFYASFLIMFKLKHREMFDKFIASPNRHDYLVQNINRPEITHTDTLIPTRTSSGDGSSTESTISITQAVDVYSKIRQIPAGHVERIGERQNVLFARNATIRIIEENKEPIEGQFMDIDVNCYPITIQSLGHLD